MAASHSADVWFELNATCKALPYGTVADLKHIIISINNECGGHIIRSGKKQDLIDRLCTQFGAWKSNNNVAKWTTTKAIIGQLKLPVSSFVLRKPSHRFLPIVPMASLPPPPHRYRFKQSPFFTIDQVVSPVLECPESYTPTDRRECTLRFGLNNEQLAKIRASNSMYQVRLFCTSSKFYSPGYNGNVGCLVEFPATCEIYVNNVQLKGALLKGIKKRPGTAPPPDLGTSRRTTLGQGQLELKKYYLVAQLVKTQSVSALVDQLRISRFVSSAEIRRQMVAATPDDDDIIAGSLKMSLRCPLSFMRIGMPCRSSRCTHSQCFDANSWYAVMQQTTTWLCPVCENTLDWRELIIDGFFAEILKTTPDSVDDVLVESDGQWRTADGRYSSSGAAAGAGMYEVISDEDDSDIDFD
ncbi:PINIT domain-containing protein [Mycena rosella]|uniref:PINIT domain-containing protein n=1 Tax=Mycena rosella TaxID=1033263 RepID=A0AAD7DF88_MYCRO|nr:PINIT domain-containing protein [Mycena rosella]